MINNYICETCDKNAVCKVMDILHKFHEDNKRSLGVEITINRCANYALDSTDEE